MNANGTAVAQLVWRVSKASLVTEVGSLANAGAPINENDRLYIRHRTM